MLRVFFGWWRRHQAHDISRPRRQHVGASACACHTRKVSASRPRNAPAAAARRRRGDGTAPSLSLRLRDSSRLIGEPRRVRTSNGERDRRNATHWTTVTTPRLAPGLRAAAAASEARLATGDSRSAGAPGARASGGVARVRRGSRPLVVHVHAHARVPAGNPGTQRSQVPRTTAARGPRARDGRKGLTRPTRLVRRSSGGAASDPNCAPPVVVVVVVVAPDCDRQRAGGIRPARDRERRRANGNASSRRGRDDESGESTQSTTARPDSPTRRRGWRASVGR